MGKAMRDITPLVAPGSIAVIGASTDPAKSGGILFKNLVDGGFKGPLYPVNPRAETVMDLKAYPTITEVPETVDLVFIVVPRQHVTDALAQCAASGARAACVITAGFSEIGDGGEDALKEIAGDGNILVAGPNTVGIVNAEIQMMGSFVSFPEWKTGGVSLFAQSGLFAGVYLLQVMSAETQRLGVGKSVAVGNKVDVDEIDFLAYAAEDAGTEVIGFYLESLGDPRGFLDLAAKVRDEKPIVVLKSGRTSVGAKASASHTGALATDDAMLDAALDQYGIVRAEDEDDFLGLLKAFSMLTPPQGRRVGVLTTSGALGVMAVDQISDAGMEIAEFAPATLERLQLALPDWQPAGNPYDFWVALDVKGNRAGHEVPLYAAMADENTDMVLALLLASPNSDFPGVREVFENLRRKYPEKPLVLVIHGGAERDRWLREIEGLGLPVYASSSAAVRVLGALAFYGDHANAAS